jgi:uncharacterized repeat protein (TIGR01451 family)
MKARLALAMVLAALGPAAAADAATTVGSDLSKAATDTVCAPGVGCTYFTGDGTTGAPVAVAPFDGVIVRWRVKSGSAASAVALRALRATGGGNYVGVGTSESEQLQQPGTGTFATRLVVKAGDVIGLDNASGAKLFASPVSTAAYFFAPPLGAFAHMPTKQSSRELLVNADIERDADGDGYGDETQDLCPGDETRHATCLSNLSVSVRPEPAPLTVGRSLTYTIKVANEGPSTAQDVGLTVSLPFSATPLQARAGRGFCTGSYTVTCRLGPIDRNDSGTVVLTVRPEVVGTLLVTAVATTPTDQSATTDDTVTSDVTVLPPTLRLLDLRLSRSEFRVGGRTAIKWYMTDAAAVNVKLEQITRRGRHLPYGSFRVAGRPGSNAVAFRGRMPHRKRLKPGTYRFTVSASTLDGRVATPGLLGFIVRRRHG